MQAQHSWILVFLNFFVLSCSSDAKDVSPRLQGKVNSCDFETYSPARDATSSLRVAAWVSQANYRGTFDILWTSIVTIGISTYTMLCLNVPAPKDSGLRIIGRRVLWMLLGIIGPEFVLTYASGQWSRAKWSVQAFKKSGYHDWNMRQAFFAEMGGFTLNTKNSDPFPLNSTQLHWLVTHGHIEFPSITKREIWDKSKKDTFTKAIASFQVGYLILHCVARAAQGLTITILELNALAIVVCALMTSYAWLHKPADVCTPVHIHSPKTLEELIGSQDWNLTPLDFVDENGPGYSVNVQPFMRMPVIPPVRPIQRIPNDRFPTNPYGVQEYLLCFATILFTVIHLAAWNFDFPTAVEQLLWRISSLLLFGITLAFWILETVASWTRLGRWKFIWLYLFDKEGLENHKRLVKRKTISNVKRKMADLPLPWEFAAIAPLAVIYGIARLFLIFEAFAELRNMNATAYVNVEWTYFIPHV